ncbi:hypothetical protein [Jiulongibacter sp. NS-SX5]|uniref:hypothetical protein n=1 Tax=Jiulongibacter sp. NS-SX5 TaxID=3463854 RepID=UPI00405823F9
MEKRLDQDHRLLAEKLEGFEVTDWSKDGVWENISSEVFEEKKGKPLWWWYASAAVILLVGTFTAVNWLSSSEQELASNQSEPAEMFNDVIIEEEGEFQSNDKLDVNNTIDVVKSAKKPNPTIAMSSAPKPVRIQKVEPLTVQKITTEKVKITLLENKPQVASKTPNQRTTHEINTENEAVLVEDDKPIIKQEKPQLAAISEVSKDKEVSKEELTTRGKKIVLVIEDIEEGRTNEKKGFFKKVGEFNRSGNWEKTEKQEGAWAKFIKSTKPGKKTIQL